MKMPYCWKSHVAAHFVLVNSVDPEEMLNYGTFIRLFTVCQSAHLGVIRQDFS